MPRTLISQPSQVHSSETYDDALSVGSGLQTGSTSLEYDLNALRTQVKRILWGAASGSWFDSVSEPSGSGSGRGLNTVNYDLTDVEQKRLLFRRQVISMVDVATGSNVALLSSSLGTAPVGLAVVYHPLLTSSTAVGTIVSLLSGSEGSYGTASLSLVSGSTRITPKNLCVIRDAYTLNALTTSAGSHQIYGLLQVESGTNTGDAFGDVSTRSQISFVYPLVSNGTASLTLASSQDVGGRSINCAYVERTAFDDISEEAFLFDDVFVGKSSSTTSTTTGSLTATQVGQVLYSIDGATFSAQMPITSPSTGWLIQDDGLHIVAG